MEKKDISEKIKIFSVGVSLFIITFVILYYIKFILFFMDIELYACYLDEGCKDFIETFSYSVK